MLMYYTPKKQKESKTYSSNNDKVQRTSNLQCEVMREFFNNLEGPVTKADRAKAVELTGLDWRKIYKWGFDNCITFKYNQ
jgi:hypothetical protein